MKKYIILSLSIAALIAASLVFYSIWRRSERQPIANYSVREKRILSETKLPGNIDNSKLAKQKNILSTFNLISEYEKSQDLYDFVQKMERLGREGNPNAYAMAALAINSCTMMSVPGYSSQLYNAKHVSDSARYDSAIARLSQRCSRLISMDGVSSSIVQDLLKKSAKEGSPIGAAKLIAEDPTLKKVQLEPLVKQIIAAANPIAYRELAITVGINSQLTGKDAGDLADTYGLEILSCKLGNNCGPQSVIMMQLCINTQFCKSMDYVSFLKQQLPSAVFLKASDLSRRLQNEIDAGHRPSLQLVPISAQETGGKS